MPPAFKPSDISNSARVGIVAARFNATIVEALLHGCLARLAALGVSRERVDLEHVPGAFELPVAAKWMIDSGHVHAVICLGCVIRGDTPHFDFVAGEAARGIQLVSIETGVPVIFGVLTTNTEEQAWARAGRGLGDHGHAGERAAEAALEMIAVRERMKRKS